MTQPDTPRSRADVIGRFEEDDEEDWDAQFFPPEDAPRKPSPPGVNIPFQAGSARAVKVGTASALASLVVLRLVGADIISLEEAALLIPVATGFFAGLEKFLRERKLWI